MTVITNMVVALMIVTQGEEPVKALPLDWDVSNIQLCTMKEPMRVPTPSVATGSIETLYRKTCKTNFVYSANIDVGKIHGPCKKFGCDRIKQYTIEELFKCPIRGIYFETPIEQYCEKHECLNYLAR